MIQDHLVVVAPAGLLRETACLGEVWSERLDENVVLLFDGLRWGHTLGWGILWGGSRFAGGTAPGGPDTLALAAHVTFMSLL